MADGLRTLVLVRHGQSTWNVEGRIQGHADPGLTDLGAEQAATTAAWIAEVYPSAALYSSDLRRCRETVAPLERALGVSAILREDLRERAFGAWTGRSAAEVAAEWADLHARWRAGEDVVAQVGGESTVALIERSVAAFERITAATDDGGVAVCVTHGGTIWHGLHRLLGLVEPALGPVANTSVTEIQAQPDAGTLLLRSWNQVAHLPLAHRTWFRPVRGVATDATARAAAEAAAQAGADGGDTLGSTDRRD